MEQDKMLYCENCNAPIPADAAKCPYCGALNAVGGEKKYMEDLFELKDDVKELQTAPVKAYKEEVRKTGKMIRSTLFAVIIAALCIWGLDLWVHKSFDEREPIEDVKAQLDWERENYPKLDELYEEKDFDGILEFENQVMDEGLYSISGWEHYYFINEYRRYMSFKGDAAVIVSGNYDKDNVYWCIVDAMLLKQDKSYAGYTDEELQNIEDYRAETNDFLIDTLGMEQDEIDELYDECCAQDKYGFYFNYKLAEKKIKAYIKNNMGLK